MVRPLRGTLLALVLMMCASQATAARLRVVGSSALFPFVVAVAERFGYQFEFGTPVVESTGTGGGIKYFCSGRGARFPDIVSASRPMTASEKELCARCHVGEILEIPLGLDALVLVRAKEGLFFDLSVEEVRRASEAQTPLPMRWQDVNTQFPDEVIKLFLPPLTAGTREVFHELILGKNARERRDGALRSVADQESVIARKLVQTPDAIGVISYAFLYKNQDTLRPFKMNGVEPTVATITNKRYPLVRPVYLYVKKEALQNQKDLQAFVRYVVSDCVTVLLERYGLVGLPPREKKGVLMRLNHVLKQEHKARALCQG